MQVVEYKALANGTLSNPYRFVEKDEIVYLPEGFKSKWLVPVAVANSLPVEGIMSHINTGGQRPNDAIAALRDPAFGPNQTYSPQYNQVLEDLKAGEALRDGKTSGFSGIQQPIAPAGSDIIQEPVDNQTGGVTAQGEGSGNQDVL